MRRLFLDFETYWADDFSLKSMTPIEYANDQRFEALGCAFIHEGHQAKWVDGPDLPGYLHSIDWPNTYAISHNALFDMLVLSLRYGHVPGFYGDTLGMAKNWISHHTGRVSLEACAQYYGMSAKWQTVNKTKGVSFDMLEAMPDLHREVAGYAMDDTAKCREIFNRIMADGFPPGELQTIDMVIRMATQPKFELDAGILAAHLADVQAKKAQLLADAQLDADNVSSIMSDQQLAAKLLFLGVDIPMKISKKTGKQAYAFAKSDKGFTELLEHPEPMVQALVAARLGHKSTLEESRTERMLSISRGSAMMPIPLKVSGAHTHRLSGDWKINMQNLPRGGQLRKALRAPKGKVVVSVDASQIEARLNAVFAGETDLVAAFAAKRDVYAEFAKLIYGYEVHKERNKVERFVGKTGILSLGYGSGAPVFQNMCRVQGDVTLLPTEAATIVSLYRATYRRIVANWYHAGQVIIPAIASGASVEWGPVRTEKYALVLPNGNRLRYRDLKHEMYEGHWQWSYMRGPMPTKVYGAKLVENVVQAIAFIHIMDTAKRVAALTNRLLLPAHQVHDELIYVVDERHGEQVRDLVVREMSTPPAWMPDAPLAAEGHIGDSYGDVH